MDRALVLLIQRQSVVREPCNSEQLIIDHVDWLRDQKTSISTANISLIISG